MFAMEPQQQHGVVDDPETGVAQDGTGRVAHHVVRSGEAPAVLLPLGVVHGNQGGTRKKAIGEGRQDASSPLAENDATELNVRFRIEWQQGRGHRHRNTIDLDRFESRARIVEESFTVVVFADSGLPSKFHTLVRFEQAHAFV